MTLDEFVKKYNNKFLDFDGKWGAQCVDLFRFYVKEVLGLPQSPPVPSAKDIWDTYPSEHYVAVKNTPSGVPKKGDIVIWGSTYGKHGHVAIFLEGDQNQLICFSQNDPTGELSVIKKYQSYRGIVGWLHPKINDNIDKDTAVNDQTKLNFDFVTELESYGTLELGTVKAKIKAKDRDLFNSHATIKNLEVNLNASETNYALLYKENEELGKQLPKLREENQALIKEVSELKLKKLPEPLFTVFGFSIHITRP